jgi:HEAT repeat protein
MAPKSDPISNAIANLRESNDGTPAAKERVRSAILGTHPRLIVARAQLAAQSNHVDLAIDLVQAVTRLLDSGAILDPYCRAKEAILNALTLFGHSDPELFVRGLNFTQHEQGEETGVPIRSLCALYIPNLALGPESLLKLLTPLLFDPSPQVRQNTIRAIGFCVTWEATLLLEMKLRGGDEEPAVGGECMLELVNADAERYLPLVVQDLRGGYEIRFQAICALSECRNPLAAKALIDSCGNAVDGSDLEERYFALGRSRHEIAREFLQDRLTNGNETERALATRLLRECV